MALEAVVFPQITQELFSYGSTYRDLFSNMVSDWSCDYGTVEEEDADHKAFSADLNGNWVASSPSLMVQQVKELELTSSSPENFTRSGLRSSTEPTPVSNPGASARRKRRRTKSCKNKEEVENQRMTHIAVERNRRKQMNEYLAVLRSLMPASYVQRGDQASIIGGAINFVKELEQLLQSMEAQKRIKQPQEDDFSSPFANFFTFPQYSSSTTQSGCGSAGAGAGVKNELVAENRSAILNIEVTLVESHANLKVLSRRRPRQLLKMVAGFQNLRFTILHLNVTTTADDVVLYSFSLKVEEECQLTSTDDIYTAVHQMMDRIQEEATLS